MSQQNQDDEKTRTHTVLTNGTMVGHYRIVEKIGAGGMGEVFLADDTELDRKVALKFLPQHMCADEDCRTRFKREAQAAAGLDHPNIVTVYEVGEYIGRPFFAMQHIEGQSLKDCASGKELTINDILELGIQVGEGLQAAHDKGITHRDIKPSNILIDSHSRVRIVDFGLASIVGKNQLTKTGSTLGTIGYMSPEQIHGKDADHRSDLFSLGIVIYEMVAGRLPFKGDTEASTMNSVINDAPEPLSRYKSGVSGKLQDIVSKLLEKDPQLRYQSAAGVMSDLKRIAKDWVSDSENEVKPPSIAVLPFANLSADPEQEYFCDGMAEEIINALTHVEGLRVVARTSCFAFKGRHEDIREIGRKLNVDNVLEGSVRKSGDRLRITGQLIKVADGYHLWSERYDRELSDIFELQDEISIAIVEKLKVKLLGGEHEQIVKRPTENLEAYNLYLKGRYHWNHRGTREVQKAIECLKKAVELDPQFALGYAGLADAYIIQGDNVEEYGARSELLARAEQTVFKAIELDSSLGEAHAALANIRFSQWKWEEVEKENILAIELNPRYATAYHWYSLYLCARGKFAQAEEKIKIARDLDPISPSIIAAQAVEAHLSGQYDKAIEICREGLEINMDSPLYSLITGWSLTELGKYDEAIKTIYRSIELAETWLETSNDPVDWMVHIGRAHALMGDHDKARNILADIIKKTKNRNVPVFPAAVLYFTLGEVDRGFEILEQSVEKKDFWIPLFRLSPIFDGVRNDPRFLSLMNKIGLDQDVQEIPHD